MAVIQDKRNILTECFAKLTIFDKHDASPTFCCQQVGEGCSNQRSNIAQSTTKGCVDLCARGIRKSAPEVLYYEQLPT